MDRHLLSAFFPMDFPMIFPAQKRPPYGVLRARSGVGVSRRFSSPYGAVLRGSGLYEPGD